MSGRDLFCWHEFDAPRLFDHGDDGGRGGGSRDVGRGGGDHFAHDHDDDDGGRYVGRHRCGGVCGGGDRDVARGGGHRLHHHGGGDVFYVSYVFCVSLAKMFLQCQPENKCTAIC